MQRLVLLAAAATLACSPPRSVGPERSCETVIRFAPGTSALAATVSGEWSAFASEPMSARPDGTFEWRGTLEPRDYAYRVAAAGQPTALDPLQPFTRWVSGRESSRLRVPDCAAPLVELVRLDVTPGGDVEAELAVSRGANGSNLAVEAGIDGAPVEVAFDAATGALRLSARGLAAGRWTLRASAADAKGRTSAPLAATFWVEAERFEWTDGLLYFAFLDRFQNGDPSNDAPAPSVADQANYRGGDLAGLRAALDDGYFERLGVRTLWLSPLEPNPATGYLGQNGRTYSGYHGYWPVAPRAVQPRFGTVAQLKDLVAAAHRRGLRVVTDLLLNHVHEDHPYWTAHRQDGWFNVSGACVCGEANCGWEARRLDCWFTRYLPDLDWRSAAVADAYEADARFWLDEVGVDGFRLDAVKHLELTGSRSMRGVVQGLSASGGQDYLLLGETFAGETERSLVAQWLKPGLLDGQFDFPLYWRLVDVFARGDSLRRLDEGVRDSLAAYPASARMSPFLGNHDVPRFASIAAGQVEVDPLAQAWGARPADVAPPAAQAKLALAFTFLLTAPGVPLLYYGDELGLMGTGDPDNRRPMKWGALDPGEAAQLARVQALGSARARSLALRRGDFRTLLVEDDVWVYQREAGNEAAFVALNRGAGARQLQVQAAGQAAAAPSRTYRDALSGLEVTLGGPTAQPLTLAGGAALVLLPKR